MSRNFYKNVYGMRIENEKDTKLVSRRSETSRDRDRPEPRQDRDRD